MFQIQQYAPSYYPTLKSWWEARGAEVVMESMLPPSGCVVEFDGEPVAGGFLYLCNSNHVAFFHGLVTKPGLSIAQTREAVRHLRMGLEIIMRSGGHTLMLGCVQPGAMVRMAVWMGFKPTGPLVQNVISVVHP